MKACQSNSRTKTRHFSLCSALNWSMKKAGISYKAWSCQFLRKCFSLTYGKLWKAGKALFGGQRRQVLCLPFLNVSILQLFRYLERNTVVFDDFSHPQNQMYLLFYTNQPDFKASIYSVLLMTLKNWSRNTTNSFSGSRVSSNVRREKNPQLRLSYWLLWSMVD